MDEESKDRRSLSDCSPKFQRRRYSIFLKKLSLPLQKEKTQYAQNINANCLNSYTGELGVLDRAEALAVLHEISEACRESIEMNSVSIDIAPISASSKGYRIKINCALDISSRQNIEPVLKKHKLFLKESEGFIVIQDNI